MKKLFLLHFALMQLFTIITYSQVLTPVLTHEMTADEELRKHEIGRDFIISPPPSQPVRMVAEFEAMQSVLIRYPFGIPMSLIAEMAEDCDVKTIVASTSQQQTVLNQYIAAGVDTSNCEWLIAPTNSYWTRDYGPWFVVDSSHTVGICDFPYNRPRPYDDNIPVVLAGQMDIPLYGMNLIHTGGNWMCDGIEAAASTQLVWTENPGLSEEDIDSLVQSYLGIETYHVLPDPLDEYIEHIDCWGKFLGVDKVLIGQVPENDYRYEDFEYVADYFASQTCSYGTPYEVIRIYTPGTYPYTPYTNSLILNEKVFVPMTGSQWDDEAIAVYEEAMPGYEIIGVQYSSWQNTDALHCRAIGIADTGMLYIRHIPLHDTVEFSTSYNIESEIFPYTGKGLIPDSLKCYFKINNGVYQSVPVQLTAGNLYRADLPLIASMSEVSYFLHAADSSGRTKSHPYIGAPDPHQFTTGFATTDVIDTDTLIFSNTTEMNSGKTFNIYNFTSTELIVNEIENESSGTFGWYIDPWNISLPHEMPSIDTLSLKVKIETPVNNQLTDVLFDTLDITTMYAEHHVIIQINVAGRWTGAVSGDWNTESNWSDGIVPISPTDIFIPSNSPNWPVFNGNLIIGETCGNVTMESNAQLTVNGIIIVNPGKKLVLFSGAVVYQLTGGL